MSSRRFLVPLAVALGIVADVLVPGGTAGAKGVSASFPEGSVKNLDRSEVSSRGQIRSLWASPIIRQVGQNFMRHSSHSSHSSHGSHGSHGSHSSHSSHSSHYSSTGYSSWGVPSLGISNPYWTDDNSVYYVEPTPAVSARWGTGPNYDMYEPDYQCATGGGLSGGGAVGSLVPLSPVRMFDTRTGYSLIPNGIYVGDTGRLGALDGTGEPLRFNVFGAGGLPWSGISAIVLTLTVTSTEASAVGGYATVYPGGARPNISNLNFKNGETVANTVITPVSANGDVCVYVYGRAHVIADLSGYFANGGGYVALNPARAFDSRTRGQKIGSLLGGATEIPLLGKAGLPNSGVGAVALNVTAVDTLTGDIGGYATVYPCGPRPDSTNLSFKSKQTLANLVIAPVSAAGSTCIYSYGSSHFLVDVVGYFPSGGGYVSTTPVRAVDTRRGVVRSGKIQNSTFEFNPLGAVGLQAGSARAVSMTVTVTDTTAPDAGGYVSVFQCGQSPNVSNLNFVSGQSVSNSVIMPVDGAGNICVYVFGSANVIVDINGYFQ